MDILLLTAAAFGGSFVGVIVASFMQRAEVWKSSTKPIEPMALDPRGGHKHQFDTMLGDGKGWRCGICGWAKDSGRN